MLCFRRSRISKTPRISRHGSHTAETVRNIRGAFGFSFLWIFVCGSRKGSLAAQNRASFFSNRQIAHCLKSSEVLGAFKIYSRMNRPSAFIHKRFSAVRFFCSFHPLHNTLFKKSSRRAVFWGKISIRLQSKNRMHRNWNGVFTSASCKANLLVIIFFGFLVQNWRLLSSYTTPHVSYL